MSNKEEFSNIVITPRGVEEIDIAAEYEKLKKNFKKLCETNKIQSRMIKEAHAAIKERDREQDQLEKKVYELYEHNKRYEEYFEQQTKTAEAIKNGI